MQVTHKFISPKTEQTDPTLVGPNEWNAIHVVSGDRYIVSSDFNYPAQTPGGNLTVGPNSFVMPTIPCGVIVGSTLLISGGTGTQEVVTVTNIVGNTIFTTCTFPHSGSWTVQSATAGIQEAIYCNNGGFINLPNAVLTIYATITMLPGTIIQGAGIRDPATPGSGGTTINASNVTSGYAFDYLSPIQQSPYGENSEFVFKDFMMICGLNGIRLNNDVLPTGTNNQAYLTDNIILENLYLVGGNQSASDPNINTTVVPTLAELKTYGVAISLTNAFRAKVIGCSVYRFGIPIYVYGDENLIFSCQCNLCSVGIYLNGINPNGPKALYGNKNVVKHNKLGGFYRIGAIWQDSCGGTIIDDNYFELNTPQFQFIRVINSMKCHIGPANWYQSALSPVTVPSHYIDVSIECLIHDNDMLEGPNNSGNIQVATLQYNDIYPNIVRMHNNGSYFPQPGNRSYQGGSTQMLFPQIPGILVGSRNSMLWNAFNNPGDWLNGSNTFPFVTDPITGRWVFTNSDPNANANLFTSFFSQSGRRCRTFNLVVSARVTGTGLVFLSVSYIGNGTTALFNANLTFTTTTETSNQVTPNFSIPANETLNGYFSVSFNPSQTFVEQLEMIPVS